MKEKLKKSQASFSREAEKSQRRARKEVSLSQTHVEVVEVGGLDLELPECEMTIGGQKR